MSGWARTISRRVVCEQCATPCPGRADAAWQEAPASACPLGAWPAVRGMRGGEESTGAGDRAAELIRRRILDPLAARVPAAAGLIEAVARCGGCAGDRARLNGDGGGSAT